MKTQPRVDSAAMRVTSGCRFVDVTGIGNSGKSAVVDLLREFETVYAPEYWFEFDFLRVPNGLLDLRFRLGEDWSPIRSHYAINSFLDVADKMGRDPAWWDLPGLMRSTSQRYDRRFGGQFRRLTADFANSFVQMQYIAEWPYDYLTQGDLGRFFRKLLRRIGMRGRLLRPVLLPDGAEFDRRAQAYMNELFAMLIPPGTRTVLLNNGFEAFNPAPALDMLDARQIVVLRDPRDIYVSGRNIRKGQASDSTLLAFDNDGLNKSFLATDDLSAFVRRLRILHGHLHRKRDSRILHLRFEDLALDYDRTKTAVCVFLGLRSSQHARPLQHFRPEESAQNIGLWRKYSRQEEIRFIASELADLLFDG